VASRSRIRLSFERRFHPCSVRFTEMAAATVSDVQDNYRLAVDGEQHTVTMMRAVKVFLASLMADDVAKVNLLVRGVKFLGTDDPSAFFDGHQLAGCHLGESFATTVGPADLQIGSLVRAQPKMEAPVTDR